MIIVAIILGVLAFSFGYKYLGPLLREMFPERVK
jgi:uncharacterized membrane protein required for colicin V production